MKPAILIFTLCTLAAGQSCLKPLLHLRAFGSGESISVELVTEVYADLLKSVSGELTPQGLQKMLSEGDPYSVPKDLHLSSESLRSSLSEFQNLVSESALDKDQVKQALLHHLQGRIQNSAVHEGKQSESVKRTTHVPEGELLPHSENIGQLLQVGEKLFVIREGVIEVRPVANLSQSNPDFSIATHQNFQTYRVMATDGKRFFAAKQTGIDVWNKIPESAQERPNFKLATGDDAAMSLAVTDKILYAVDGSYAMVKRKIFAFRTEDQKEGAKPSFTVFPNGPEGVFPGAGYPNGLATDGKHLAVVDPTTHRVFFWSTLPTSSDQTADIVLGQPDFNSTKSGNGLAQLAWPIGVQFHGGKLLVADQSNERILVWKNTPQGNGSPATEEIGLRQRFGLTKKSELSGTDSVGPWLVVRRMGYNPLFVRREDLLDE